MEKTENRETFFARLQEPPASVFLSQEDIARIEMAYDLAKYAHRAQDRQDGTRYFEHVRGVALRLIDGLGLYDMPTIVAALLHDGPEDAPRYVESLKVAVLGGEEAARGVRLLTKIPKEGYVERLEVADWKVIAIKLCDRHHNFSDMGSATEAFRRKQTIETRDVYLPLFRRRLKSVPPEHYKRFKRMVTSLAWMVETSAKELGLDPPPPASA